MAEAVERELSRIPRVRLAAVRVCRCDERRGYRPRPAASTASASPLITIGPWETDPDRCPRANQRAGGWSPRPITAGSYPSRRRSAASSLVPERIGNASPLSLVAPFVPFLPPHPTELLHADRSHLAPVARRSQFALPARNRQSKHRNRYRQAAGCISRPCRDRTSRH